MADLIRTSLKSLEVIPEENKLVLHHMYEDNDIDGADKAEEIINFLEKQAPNTFVGVLANDCVSQTCGHYHCDHYDPYWYTVLVSAKIWEQYKDQVGEKDEEWKNLHGCKEQRQTA